MPVKKTEILAFAEIESKPVADKYELYKKTVAAPWKAISTAREKFGSNIVMGAKVTASLKRDYVKFLTERSIPQDTSEKKFFETHAGGVPPARVLAVATFFNAACLTLVDGKPLLDEKKHFDPHSGNTLEIAAACLSHERKVAGDAWARTDNTLEMVAALTEAGDTTSKLKAIRKRQKGDNAETDAENEAADEQAGPTPTRVLAGMLIHRIIVALPDDEGYALFCAAQEIADAWSRNTACGSAIAGWLERREKETRIRITHGETEQETDAALEQAAA